MCSPLNETAPIDSSKKGRLRPNGCHWPAILLFIDVRGGTELYDVAFVGNHAMGPRDELLDLLKRRFSRTFIGRAYFEEMAKIYSASHIVFNRSVRNDVNMRVFEALSCGSMLLTNDLSANGQAELFRDGGHLATYRSPEEFLDKAEFYLNHDHARESIAARGREEATTKHTYEHRIKRILEKTASQRVPQSVAITKTQENSSPAANGYYEHARPEILELIPLTARRILDVGCGAGRLGEAVKARQRAYVVGVECIASAAESARSRLDEVIVGDVENLEPDFEPGSFDAVVCGDVLEHLRIPERFLARARSWLRPDGVLIASIPNARHHSVIAELIEGNWSYEDAGLMDRTHLGFFTRSDMIDLFVGAGFQINRISPIPGPGYAEWEKSEHKSIVRIRNLTLSSVPAHEAEEFYVYQYLISAVPSKSSVGERYEANDDETRAPSFDRARNEGPAILPMMQSASQSIRKAKNITSEMRFTQDFRTDLDQFDFRGRPFAFVRFGDGERAVCMGKPIEAGDGRNSPGGSTPFLRDLIASLECDLEGYFIGIPDTCCDADAHAWYLGMARAPLERLTFANIFVNANYQRFRKLDLSGMAIVAPFNADFVVPENLVERHAEIDPLVDRLLEVDRPILVAAGPAANVIIHKYWQRAKTKQTIVDVGSAIDERLKGAKTRRYHLPGSPTADRVCLW